MNKGHQFVKQISEPKYQIEKLSWRVAGKDNDETCEKK